MNDLIIVYTLEDRIKVIFGDKLKGGRTDKQKIFFISALHKGAVNAQIKKNQWKGVRC